MMKDHELDMMKSSILKWVTYVFLVGFASGCKTYQDQGKRAFRHWEKGEVALATEEFAEHAEKNDDTKDHIIWHLEHATALRLDDQPWESLEAFEKAEGKIDEYEAKAKLSVSSEAGATMSNQANLSYRGRAYDKIMLNTYKALIYWELGIYKSQFDEKQKRQKGVRAELFQAYQRQQDAVEENKRRIEKAQYEERENAESERIGKARQDAKFASQLEGLNPPDHMLRKDHRDVYVNPFTVFVDGLFFQHHSEDRSDLERAQKQFERLMIFSPRNTFFESELDRIDGKMEGDLSPVTYVIFETGRAPSRDQVRIDIPIIISKVSYVGAAFPKLKFHSDHHSHLLVNSDGKTSETMLIASMDRIVGNDFKNELPIIITKTMISTIVKAVAAYVVNEAADQQGEMTGFFSRVLTASAQAAVNIADLRTWTTLPKEFQYCRIPTPANGSIRLMTPDGTQESSIPIATGSSNIVYVRSINRGTPLIVNQFSL